MTQANQVAKMHLRTYNFLYYFVAAFCILAWVCGYPLGSHAPLLNAKLGPQAAICTAHCSRTAAQCHSGASTHRSSTSCPSCQLRANLSDGAFSTGITCALGAWTFAGALIHTHTQCWGFSFLAVCSSHKHHTACLWTLLALGLTLLD